MAELDGLSMSLDDLISKRNEERRKQGQPAGRGGARGSRGRWQQSEGRGGPWQGPIRRHNYDSPASRGRGRGPVGSLGFGAGPGGRFARPPFMTPPFLPQREVMLAGSGFPVPEGMPVVFAQALQEAPAPPKLTAYVKPETQEVAVKFRDTEIVKVTESGSVKLDTGGFRGPTSLVAMNEALKVLGMKISGPSFSQWTISDGRSIVRYEDGVVLPAKGAVTESRARAILRAFTQNNTPRPPTTPPATLKPPMLANEGLLPGSGQMLFLPPRQLPPAFGDGGSNRIVSVSPSNDGGHRQNGSLALGGPLQKDKEKERRLRAQGRYMPY